MSEEPGFNNKTKPDNLIDLLENSMGGSGLVEFMMCLNRGVVLNSYAKIILLSEINQDPDFVMKILLRPSRFSSFPYLSVEVNDTKFNVFGFVHGANPDLSYVGRLSKDLLSKAHNLMLGRHNPKKQKESFLEENISYLLKLPSSLEVDDVSQGKKRARIPITGKKNTFYKIASLPFDLTSYYSLLKNLNNSNLDKSNLIDLLSLKSIYLQGKAGEIRIEHPLKEPLNLECTYLIEETENCFFYPSSCSKRSLYTAKKLLEFATDRKLEEVNYLGGLNHMTQIAYFLENPDYSFKNLDDYIDG